MASTACSEILKSSVSKKGTVCVRVFKYLCVLECVCVCPTGSGNLPDMDNWA